MQLLRSKSMHRDEQAIQPAAALSENWHGLTNSENIEIGSSIPLRRLTAGAVSSRFRPAFYSAACAPSGGGRGRCGRMYAAAAPTKRKPGQLGA